MLEAIFDRFVDDSPITVMAEAAMARVLSAERLDALFDQACQGQYVHELLFSTTFYLMADVVVGKRRSIHTRLPVGQGGGGSLGGLGLQQASGHRDRHIPGAGPRRGQRAAGPERTDGGQAAAAGAWLS